MGCGDTGMGETMNDPASEEYWLDIPSEPNYQASSAGGVKATRKVHRLVAEAFHGQIPDGMVVCHNDGDPSNNCPTNLRIDTHSENSKDRVRHGRHHCSNKNECPQGHPYSSENTKVKVNPDGSFRCRSCRQCARDYALNKYHASGGMLKQRAYRARKAEGK